MLATIETITKVLGTLLVPFVLLYLGSVYKERDEKRASQELSIARERAVQQEDLQAQDRGRDLLLSIGDYITSSEPRKQLYGIALLEDMRRSREIPEALVKLVQDLSTSSRASSTPAQVGVEGDSERASTLTGEVKSAADHVLKRIRAPRLYVHIANEDQRAVARAFEQMVEGRAVNGAAIVVPGIERVGSAPPATELRFFKEGEQETASAISRIINELLGVSVGVRDLSARYGTSPAIRENHFELWFAPGDIRLADRP